MAQARTNITLPKGQLVGRRDVLSTLREAFLRGERLVTITGSAGVGKSRLAIEFGRSSLDWIENEGGDGVWLCRLDQVTDRAGLCDALSAALGAVEASTADPRHPVQRFGALLSERGPCLLILDGCDLLVEEVAEVLDQWMSLAPEVRFVVTTRERLQIDGEYVLNLSPLSLPDEDRAFEDSEAIRLFQQCVESAGIAFDIKDEAPFVSDIVRKLDGLPLAIELAAPRMAVMSARALEHRLRTRFDGLAQKRHSSPKHHQTLEDAIAWSWDTLEDWEKSTLAQCCVFRGGFTLDATESIVDLSPFEDAPPVIDVIQRLREKSLLRSFTVESPRKTLRLCLFESVRNFSLKDLKPTEARALEARHAMYYIERAEAWQAESDGEKGAFAREELLAERDNLLSIVDRVLGEGKVTISKAEPALRALLVLSPILEFGGPLYSYLEKIRPALEITAHSGAKPSLQGRALMLRGRLSWLHGRRDDALKDLQRAMVIAGHSNDLDLEASVLHWIGKTTLDRGDAKTTEAILAKAIQRYEELGNKKQIAAVFATKGQLLFKQGRRAEAFDLFHKALSIHQSLGVSASTARDHRLIGELHADSEPNKAKYHLEESLSLCDQTKDRRGEAWALGLIGVAYHGMDVLPQARSYLEEAVELSSKLGCRPLWARFLGQLGIVSKEEEREIEAEVLLSQAIETLAETSDADFEALFRAYRCCLLKTQEYQARERTALEHLLKGIDDSGLFLDVGLAEAIDVLRQDQVVSQPLVSIHARIAARCLDVSPDPGPALQMRHDETLVVGEEAKWFRAPGSERVNLGRRRPLRLVLERLVKERLDRPGSALTWEELLEAGWPGEQVLPSAGAHRVRVTISTLRKLGLESILRTDESGYVLSPDCSLILSQDRARKNG